MRELSQRPETPCGLGSDRCLVGGLSSRCAGAYDVYLYIVHRTQIYLPDDQTERLDERAGAEGVSRSVLIRRAVDLYLARDGLDSAEWQARWRAAVHRTAGIASYLPDGADYVEHVREIDAGRVQELDR
jgi:predicted transcriptional regulator